MVVWDWLQLSTWNGIPDTTPPFDTDSQHPASSLLGAHRCLPAPVAEACTSVAVWATHESVDPLARPPWSNAFESSAMEAPSEWNQQDAVIHKASQCLAKLDPYPWPFLPLARSLPENA